MNGAESRKTRSSCMGKAGMFWKKRSPECDGLASRACSKTVPPLLQHSHRWNGGAAKINSIHIEKFVAREMGSCDVLRKEFQGHTCESSLSVRPDLLGWKEIICLQGCRHRAGSGSASSRSLLILIYFLSFGNKQAALQMVQSVSWVLPSLCLAHPYPISLLDLPWFHALILFDFPDSYRLVSFSLWSFWILLSMSQSSASSSGF